MNAHKKLVISEFDAFAPQHCDYEFEGGLNTAYLRWLMRLEKYHGKPTSKDDVFHCKYQ